MLLFNGQSVDTVCEHRDGCGAKMGVAKRRLESQDFDGFALNLVVFNFHYSFMLLQQQVIHFRGFEPVSL